MATFTVTQISSINLSLCKECVNYKIAGRLNESDEQEQIAGIFCEKGIVVLQDPSLELMKGPEYGSVQNMLNTPNAIVNCNYFEQESIVLITDIQFSTYPDIVTITCNSNGLATSNSVSFYIVGSSEPIGTITNMANGVTINALSYSLNVGSYYIYAKTNTGYVSKIFSIDVQPAP